MNTKLIEKLKLYWKVLTSAKRLDKSIGLMMASETMEDAQDAINCIQEFADLGHPFALEAQGALYSDESKPWYDRNKAVEAWEKVAKIDGGESMYDLGLFYFSGRTDMEPNPILGKYWMDKAADAGNKDAIEFLRRRYGR